MALNMQKAQLLAQVSVAGSGAGRYAAAMFFYTKGLMPTDMLEIYRRCSKFDQEDPVKLAHFEGVELPSWLVGEMAASDT
ncbi:MAG: hypothetical protein ABJL67_19915 [Sulfitobacter sp.]